MCMTNRQMSDLSNNSSVTQRGGLFVSVLVGFVKTMVKFRKH